MTKGRSRRLWRWIGLVLLALPLAGAGSTLLLSAQAERRFPPQGSFVTVEGLALRYVRAGQGRPLVLLHGAFGGLEDFRATIWDALAPHGERIAFDRPGSGYSQRPTDEVADPRVQARLLHAAARELGIEQPTLVGFSYGAAVALAWALEWPDEVAGVVTVAGAVMPWEGTPDLAFRLAGLPLLGPLFAYTLAEPLGAALAAGSVRTAFAPAPVPADFEASPFALGLRPKSFLANAQDMRGLNAFLARQAQGYAGLDVPVLLLHGSADQVAHASVHSQAAARRLPRATYVAVEGAGHQLLYSHPEAVLAALEAWLEVAGRER